MKKAIRILAILGNLFLFGLIVFNIFKHGWPKGYSIAQIAIFTALLLNVIALLLSPTGKSENLLALYFQRKILEEKKKIETLNAKPEA